MNWFWKGVGPHGFSVWGHASHKCFNNTGCTAIDKKGECQDKGGPHWMVQETAWYGQDSKRGKEWYIYAVNKNVRPCNILDIIFITGIIVIAIFDFIKMQ